MKYFRHNRLDYHCSDIFNWKAVDRDGTLFLYQNEPFTRTKYWTSGHTDSYDYRVYVENQVMCDSWLNTLERL